MLGSGRLFDLSAEFFSECDWFVFGYSGRKTDFTTHLFSSCSQPFAAVSRGLYRGRFCFNIDGFMRGRG
jgi:hypothetical protein